MFSPEWIEAAADVAAAVEKGVAMRSRKPAETVAAAAAPAPVNVTFDGLSGQDWMKGVLVMAGSVLVLAAAMLAGALIIHHGLVA